MGLRQVRLSQRHEKDVADWLPGGHQSPGSGNNYLKLDVYDDSDGSYWNFLIENKCTQHSSYRITKELWDYIEQRTYERDARRRPVLAVRLYGNDYDSTGVVRVYLEPEDVSVECDLAVLSIHDFLELVETNKKLQSQLKELQSAQETRRTT